jgi:hypothetical protein
MRKQTSLHVLLNSAVVALGLWSIPAAQAQICTREYAPVCGQIAGQAPQTFPNRCVLDNAQARFIALGECTNTALPQPQPVPQPMPGSDSAWGAGFSMLSERSRSGSGGDLPMPRVRRRRCCSGWGVLLLLGCGRVWPAFGLPLLCIFI